MEPEEPPTINQNKGNGNKELEPSQVIDAIEAALRNKDSIRMREISSSCSEPAVMHQSEEFVELAIISYALHKILSKIHYRAEIDELYQSIQDDLENGSRMWTPYSIIIRWAGGWDKTLAPNLGPRQALDLYAMLAKSWSPNGDVRDIPIRGGSERFIVVVHRMVEHGARLQKLHLRGDEGVVEPQPTVI